MEARLAASHIARLFYLLVAFEIFLSLAYVVESIVGSPAWLIHRLLNLDLEGSIATWFSVVQLALVGSLLLAAAAMGVGRLQRWFVALAGVAFLFLSADEGLQLHESVTLALAKVEAIPRFNNNHGVWIPIYLSLIVVAGICCVSPLKRLWQVHRASARWAAAGVGCFLSGAVGLEIVVYEYELAEAPAVFFHAEIVAEEFLEMIGGSMLLRAALLHVGGLDVSPHADELGWVSGGDELQETVDPALVGSLKLRKKTQAAIPRPLSST